MRIHSVVKVITLSLLAFSFLNNIYSQELIKTILLNHKISHLTTKTNLNYFITGEYPSTISELSDDDKLYHINIYSKRDFKLTKSIETKSGGITSIKLNSDGSKFLTTEASGFLTLWSTSNLEKVFTFDQLNNLDNAIFLNDNQTIVASEKSAHKILVLSIDGVLIKELFIGKEIDDFLINPNTFELILACHNEIQIWSIIADKKVKTIPCEGIRIIKVSEMRGIIAAGKINGDIEVFDLGYNHLSTLSKHFKSILSMDFTVTGNYLVSSSSDFEINIWNANNFTLKKAISNAHKGNVRCVSFINKELHIASSGDDLKLNIWKWK